MKDYIAKSKGKGGVLGRVLHYVIRYEVQGRGSIHAHIILWLHPDDVNNVSDEIVAVIPAEFDELTGQFVEPTNAEQRGLSTTVQRKNMHRCGEVCGKQ